MLGGVSACKLCYGKPAAKVPHRHADATNEKGGTAVAIPPFAWSAAGSAAYEAFTGGVDQNR